MLTVNGNDFRRDSLVVWNNSFLATGFVSRHQLSGVVPAADVAQREQCWPRCLIRQREVRLM